MKKIKLGIVSVLLTVGMVATLGLSGCGLGQQVAELIQGDVTGEVNKEYKTEWFTFTVESMSTNDTYEDYTASEGNTLLIAKITEKNTFGVTQPFGTFDWYIDAPSLSEYLWPMSPLNNNMMPDSFNLEDGEECSYDVVIEFPADLADAALTYQEIDEEGTSHTTFSIPIK